MNGQECDGCRRTRDDAREVTVRKGDVEGDVVVCPDCEDDLNGDIVDDTEVRA